MTKGSIVALFSAAAICSSGEALSEEPARGWTIGAELGQASFADEDDTAFKLLGAEGPTIDAERVELTYGIGIQYDMTRQIGIRGQWQRYDSEEEVDLFSVGVVWRF